MPVFKNNRFDAIENTADFSGGVFLYSENPALDAGFSRAYSGEVVKALQLG